MQETESLICRKNEQYCIDPENIWEGDLFERKQTASDFSKIIKSIKQPFVISINAPYGSGKSFFIQRWREDLKKEGEATVFFNAWNCDFTQNPLLPFMYNFLEQLKEQFLTSDNKLANKALDLVKEVGNNIISKATNEIIDFKKLAEVTSESGEIIKGKPLDNYKETLDNLEKFKVEIEEVVKHLEGNNIYIFVDELERCRPTFAVELLESIKHLFNIPGLVFILGIDRSQLKHTISNIYGINMDSEGYIRRFIDLELSLPPANINQFIQMLCRKLEIEHKKSQYNQTWTAGYEYFNMFFELFAKPYKLSLREIEQCYTEFNIITKTIPEGTLLVTPVLAFLIISKNKNNGLYTKLGVEISTGEQILDYLEKYVKPLIPPTMDRMWEHFLDLMVMTFEQNLDTKLEEAKKILEKDPENIRNKTLGLKYQNAAKCKQNPSYHLWNINILEYLKCKLMYISKERF